MTPSPTEDGVQTAREALDEAVKHWMWATGTDAGLTASLAYIEARNALVAAVEHRVRAEGVADTKRLDWLEGEMEREQSWPSTIPLGNASLFRRNTTITRKAIDEAMEAPNV